MRVIKRGVMPDGTAIQLEDWSDNYNFFTKNAHLAAYPKAKETRERIHGFDYPERRKKFRLSFYFGNEQSAELAFLALQNGEKQLKEFRNHADDKVLFNYI